ncbi:MAG: hypothetical protein V1793_25085 [Pseudomonadota bacterium]
MDSSLLTPMDALGHAIIILAFGLALKIALTPLFDYLTFRLNGQRGFSDKEQKQQSESDETSNKMGVSHDNQP